MKVKRQPPAGPPSTCEEKYGRISLLSTMMEHILHATATDSGPPTGVRSTDSELLYPLLQVSGYNRVIGLCLDAIAGLTSSVIARTYITSGSHASLEG